MRSHLTSAVIIMSPRMMVPYYIGTVRSNL